MQGGPEWRSGEANLFDGRSKSHFVRELVKELQPLQILFIQRIIDIPGQVNPDEGRREAEKRRIFRGDFVNVRQAEVARSVKVRTALREGRAMISHPESED